MKNLFVAILNYVLQKLKSSSYVVKINNLSLVVPRDMHWCFTDGDYYEKNVIYFLDLIFKNHSNPIFLDIGANCGYYSIKYANQCNQIFAFEPFSKTFKLLAINIRRNHLKNIIPLSYGLSNTNEGNIINIYNSSGNNSVFLRKVPMGHSLKKIGVEKIELRKLDDLIKNDAIAVPNIIKIDVEGGELNVFKGAELTIKKYRPTIVFEYADTTSNDAGYQKEDLLTILQLVDYKIYGILEDTNDLRLIKQENLNKFPIANIIFIPQELDNYLYGLC